MTLNLQQARADWDAVEYANDLTVWANEHGSSLLAALEARSGDADELARRAERIAALEQHNRNAESVCIDVVASLAAAISLLERGGKSAKKAAPSDAMFDQMIRDYKHSLERARTALGETI